MRKSSKHFKDCLLLWFNLKTSDVELHTSTTMKRCDETFFNLHQQIMVTDDNKEVRIRDFCDMESAD
ncbi:unnamed protein product [Brugia pahangi]|uniref:Uncharacterized protein n=1 Tax=Brugia pahangi TaxID=6280 RepID=A0A0N4SWX2_BRUPA|nr:unnamed protein product [Brugia pahangi]